MRVNALRKAGLAVEDRIALALAGPTPELREALQRHRDLIAAETLALVLVVGAALPASSEARRAITRQPIASARSRTPCAAPSTSDRVAAGDAGARLPWRGLLAVQVTASSRWSLTSIRWALTDWRHPRLMGPPGPSGFRVLAGTVRLGPSSALLRARVAVRRPQRFPACFSAPVREVRLNGERGVRAAGSVSRDRHAPGDTLRTGGDRG